MNLTDRALLAQLGISQWMGRKLDKTASRKVTNDASAAEGSARVNKDLLPGCEELKAVHSKSSLIRTKFYDNTLPWGLDGMQILTTGNFLPFMTDFRKEKGEWQKLVKIFLSGYEMAKYNAENDKRRSLGRLYTPTDYPRLQDIEGKFNIDLAIFPVPADDFRVAIASDELDRIRQDVTARVLNAQSVAMKEVWQRLFDKVKCIAEKCADPKAIFRDTLMENAREMCELLPRLNMTDDPNLEAMRQEVEAKLIMHPESLRNDPDLRRKTAAEAKQIMDVMGTFMGAI